MQMCNKVAEGVVTKSWDYWQVSHSFSSFSDFELLNFKDFPLLKDPWNTEEKEKKQKKQSGLLKAQIELYKS